MEGERYRTEYIHVFREAVEDLSERFRIKEHHLSLHDVAQQVLVEDRGGANAAFSE